MSDRQQTIPGVIWHHPGRDGSDIVTAEMHGGAIHYPLSCGGDRQAYAEAALECERRSMELWPDRWKARHPNAR
jgi:hypothetical protein